MTECVASAAEIRVGILLGRGDGNMARLVTYKSFLLSCCSSLLAVTILYSLGEDIPSFFTQDPVIQDLMGKLIPLLGFYELIGSCGAICSSILSAQDRYKLQLFLGTLTSWFVTIPLAGISSIYFRFSLEGLLAAIIIGYVTSNTVNTYLVFRSDWNEISRKIVEQNEGESDSESESESGSSTSKSQCLDNSRSLSCSSSLTSTLQTNHPAGPSLIISGTPVSPSLSTLTKDKHDIESYASKSLDLDTFQKNGNTNESVQSGKSLDMDAFQEIGRSTSKSIKSLDIDTFQEVGSASVKSGKSLDLDNFQNNESEKSWNSLHSDTRTRDTPTKDVPTNDTQTKDVPTNDTQTKDTSTNDTQTKDSPTNDTLTKDTPKKYISTKDEDDIAATGSSSSMSSDSDSELNMSQSMSSTESLDV